MVVFCPTMIIAETTSQRRPNTATDIAVDIPGSFSVTDNNKKDNSHPFHCVRSAISANFHLYWRLRASACRRIHRFPAERNWIWKANAPALAGRAFALVRPLLVTSRPAARLRMVEHRGVVSAAMVYDDLPIIDAFRRVDDDTVLGVMDLRWQPHPYVFVLRRD